jgi:CelD/BcsL family acetyltransferase involved in cellulose biosynthesis
VLKLERVPVGGADAGIEAARTANVFCTPEWLDYVARTQDAEPVVAQVESDGVPVGAFTGLIVRRMGVRILGSPFQGWMTGPMGFSLAPGISHGEAMRALAPFAFRELGCLHVEVTDRGSSFDEVESVRGRVDRFNTFELDLRRDEDALLAGMTSGCRRALRKGEREGVSVERASGVEFADEYYDQLREVFERQSLAPPYPRERVRELIRCVEPSGGLLLLRAVGPDGDRIASAIFPHGPQFGYFWGGASWAEQRHLRPNELIFWHAIRHFREHAVAMFDFGGGGGQFKSKFGGPQRAIPVLRRSRVPGMLALRDVAARIYKRRAMRVRRAPEPFPRATARGLRPRTGEPDATARSDRRTRSPAPRTPR